MPSAFIAHRLRLAGGTGEEIAPEATEIVYEATGGVPRLVNQLCDLSMLYAWSDNQSVVTEQVVRRVLEDGVFFGGGILEGETG